MEYSKIAESYNELHKEEQINKYRIIKENLTVNKKDKLLDVGCGTGLGFELFECECYGIDPCRELTRQYMGKANIFHGQAESLPFKENFFDIVISVTAIHNFDNIEQALKEMKRVGKEKYAFSILKKSRYADKIIYEIKKTFRIKKEIVDKFDTILMTF